MCKPHMRQLFAVYPPSRQAARELSLHGPGPGPGHTRLQRATRAAEYGTCRVRKLWLLQQRQAGVLAQGVHHVHMVSALRVP